MRLRAVLSLAPTCLAVAIWFGATFFLLGDIGKHNEDYGMVMGDPALGSWNPVNAHPWLRFPYFFRPLLLAHSGAINTLSWNHHWIGHLELALVHGLVAWMLKGLLERLGIRRPIAFAAALLFMACPLLAEGVLWTTASCVPFGCVFLLRTLELARRQGAGPSSPLRTLSIGGLAFITACWYEPAAAALLALPLVVLAGGASAGVSWRRSWRPALHGTVAAGAACVLYVALLVGTAPAGNRGGAASFVSRANLLEHARSFFKEVAGTMCGHRARDILAGSIEEGWRTVQTPVGWAWLALTLALVPIAALAMDLATPRLASGVPPEDPGGAAPPRRGVLALVGITMFFAAWLPIIVVERMPVDLRWMYVPLVGVVVFGAALVNGVAGALRGSARGARAAMGRVLLTVALSAAVAGAIGLIGFQAQLRLDTLHDRAAVEHLRRLVPDPPPGTVFVPLRVGARDVNTGHPLYDHAIRTAGSWPARALVRSAYRRADITITPTAAWLTTPDRDGFRYLKHPGRIEWNRCIPFTVDAAGVVNLVRRLTVVPDGGPSFDVDFPRAAASNGSSWANAAPLRLLAVRGGRCVLEDTGTPTPHSGDRPPDGEPTLDPAVP